MTNKPFGWIYRIFHKDMPTMCYIGKTEVSLAKRLQGHIRDARKVDSSKDSDAKLHQVMWAHKPKTFEIQELASAKDREKLSELEGYYQVKYQSIENGWNKVVASKNTQERGETVKARIDGKEYQASSLAALCRILEVSNNTVNHFRSKGKSLNVSIEKALAAKDKTIGKQPIVVFRKEFKNVNELAKSRYNKYKLTSSTIRKRFSAGQTYEDAVLEKPKRAKEIRIMVNGDVRTYQNKRSAHTALSNELNNIPAYSTVNSSLEKGYTIEEAFGLAKPKWLEQFSHIEKLISEGYKLIGTLNAQSKPVVNETKNEIFSSKKVFARTYGYDYTTISEEFKSGLTAEQIIHKREKD